MTPALRYACFTEQRSRFVQYECELVYQLVWQDDGIVERLDGARQTMDACGYTSQYTPPNRVVAFQTIRFDVIAEPGQHVGFRVGMQRSKPHTALLHLEPRGSSWTESAILSVLFQPLSSASTTCCRVFQKKKRVEYRCRRASRESLCHICLCFMGRMPLYDYLYTICNF